MQSCFNCRERWPQVRAGVIPQTLELLLILLHHYFLSSLTDFLKFLQNQFFGGGFVGEQWSWHARISEGGGTTRPGVL